MANVYRICKEETASGVRYLVDYRDSIGRAIVRYVQYMPTTFIAEGLCSGGKLPREKSIRHKVRLLSQVLRSAKAPQMIPTNPVHDLDWQELLGTEEHYHRRYRDIPLTPIQLLYFLDVAQQNILPRGIMNLLGHTPPFWKGGMDRTSLRRTDRPPLGGCRSYEYAGRALGAAQ